jgi:hypothetical protein
VREGLPSGKIVERTFYKEVDGCVDVLQAEDTLVVEVMVSSQRERFDICTSHLRKDIFDGLIRSTKQ